MPEPLVVTTMRQFKEQLLAREATQMAQMAQRWRQVQHALEGRINALAEECARRQAAGEAITSAKLFQLERYHALLAQLQQELRIYTDTMTPQITEQQRQYAELGIQHAAEAIEAAAPGIRGSFDVLPTRAVENMVGLAGDGSPLHDLLVQSWPDAADGLTQELIRSTALGINPRQTAERMADGTTRTLDRMMTIARTEQLRVYRESSRAQMAASGVVEGFRRIATHDSRVCAGCLAAEGEYYPVQQTLRSHPRCRCAMIPVVTGMPPLQWTQGEDWFATQPERVQRDILGPGRYDLWASGQVDFSRFAAVRTNATWGDAIVPATLQELAR